MFGIAWRFLADIWMPGHAGGAAGISQIIKNLQHLGHDVSLVVSDADIFYLQKNSSKNLLLKVCAFSKSKIF